MFRAALLDGSDDRVDEHHDQNHQRITRVAHRERNHRRSKQNVDQRADKLGGKQFPARLPRNLWQFIRPVLHQANSGLGSGESCSRIRLKQSNNRGSLCSMPGYWGNRRHGE